MNLRNKKVTAPEQKIQKSSPLKPLNPVANHQTVTPTKRKAGNSLEHAKSVFRRCSTPARLVGRDSERSYLSNFIASHLNGSAGGSLYISGCPGTGKTALLSEVVQDSKPTHCTVLELNCMNVSDVKQVYATIASKLGSKETQFDACKSFLASKFAPKLSNSKMMYLVILDEIDQLMSRNQEILYQLFEWAKAESSRLILIGIANALDLTARFLPRLEAKNGTLPHIAAPETLEFAPYNVKEIASIIKSRLGSLESSSGTMGSPSKKGGFKDQNEGYVSVMHPMAIELVARKVAGSGDLRKALDVCRQAIEIAEQESPVASASKSDAGATKAKEIKKSSTVTVKHVLAATAAMLGSPVILRIRALQMQAKLILCTIVCMAGKEIKDMSIGKIREAYFVICNYKHQVAPVQTTEFDDIITLLDSHGLVAVMTKKSKDEHKNKTVSLNVSVDDVKKAVAGSPILVNVLEEGHEALSKLSRK